MESVVPVLPEIAPESPEMTRDRLESLEGDERLDVKAIKGLETLKEDITTSVRGFIPSRSGGGVTSVISSDGSVEVTSSMAKGKGVVDLKVTSTGGGTPATTVVSEQAYSQSPVVGVGTDYARVDHSHGTPALPSKTDIGLGNVDNTSDVNKPVSTATLTAVATPPVGTFEIFSLGAGTTGVRAPTSYIQSATRTSGTMHLVLFRVLAQLDCTQANVASAMDAITSGMPRIYDNSVLQWVWFPSATTATTFIGTYVETQG